MTRERVHATARIDRETVEEILNRKMDVAARRGPTRRTASQSEHSQHGSLLEGHELRRTPSAEQEARRRIRGAPRDRGAEHAVVDRRDEIAAPVTEPEFVCAVLAQMHLTLE